MLNRYYIKRLDGGLPPSLGSPNSLSSGSSLPNPGPSLEATDTSLTAPSYSNPEPIYKPPTVQQPASEPSPTATAQSVEDAEEKVISSPSYSGGGGGGGGGSRAKQKTTVAPKPTFMDYVRKYKYPGIVGLIAIGTYVTYRLGKRSAK